MVDTDKIIEDLKAFCEERDIILLPTGCGEMIAICDKEESEAPFANCQVIDDRR